MSSAPQRQAVTPAPAQASARKSFWAHVQIARIDHWVKNVFVLPGLVVAYSLDHSSLASTRITQVLLGLFAVCLVASSNYVINEVLDAPFDRLHPTKRNRPVPSGRVSIPIAYIEWLALMIGGIALALTISRAFAVVLFVLWLMGCAYNFRPVRTKDVPYVDVLTEAINNPLRMLAGWYLSGTAAVPPASLLISYWMVGCYFMAIKRFAEYREIADPLRCAAYRKSFAFYTEKRLLVSIMFYGSHAMLFFGAFLMRYRMELILAFPLIALVMAIYLSLSFTNDSAAQNPEKLYREPLLMSSVVICSVLMGALLFINIPALHTIFTQTSVK